MKIKSITYENKQQGWEYEKIDFLDLTLLVGVSGVGKTQILNSIHSLKQITNGDSQNGVTWKIEFQTTDENTFTWEGAFENIVHTNESSPALALFTKNNRNKNEPSKISFEKLIDIDKNEILIERNSNSFLFGEQKMPKLDRTKSALFLLKEEPLFKKISENFNLIVLKDYHSYDSVLFDVRTKQEYNTLDKIRESNSSVFHKLCFVYDISKEKFNEILNRFREIFPQVEDIRIIKQISGGHTIKSVSVIQIKEKDVDTWIPHYRLSSGMLKTLSHITEIYLCGKGTVMLIDEWENSLGVNCIDILTEDILYSDDTIQFIATSHHPYIINKIPYEYWKIVTRKGGIIKTTDAKEYNWGKSHHDRFLHLVNHLNYKQGIS